MQNCRINAFIFTIFFFYSSFDAQIIQTYSYTGTVQTFTVPACISNITISASGAQGGANAQALAGGLGGSSYGVLTVTPGDVLYIYVGGSNGFNGGGLPGQSICTNAIGGIGGGASDVRLNGTSLQNRVIVGGGGGGAGGNRVVSCGRGTGGGGGGGYYGGGGGAGWPGNTPTGTVPIGGSQTAGGAGGVSIANSAHNGSMGVLGSGGVGGIEFTTNQFASNIALTGGSGGGLNGNPGQYNGSSSSETGGSWTGQSGAGGSSYTGTLSNTLTVTGNQLGNGIVSFSYVTNVGVLSATAVPSNICNGGASLLTASGMTSYSWSTGSNSSTIAVTPTATSVYTVNGTDSNNCLMTAVLQVVVDETANISVTANPQIVCLGSTTTLTAVGANSYTWSNGALSNLVSITPSVSTNYSVLGSNACGTTTASVAVTVNMPPNLTVSVSSSTVCNGSSAVLVASGANSYQWSNNVSNAVPFAPQSTGSYTVIGTSVQGCTNSAVAQISVVPFTGPSLSLSTSSTTLCVGNSVSLTASGVISYTWNNGATSSSLVVSPITNTVYQVLGVNAFGCVSGATQTIQVDQFPVVSAIGSTNQVCYGGLLTLQATGASIYSWTPTAINGVPFSPSVTGIYTVVGLNSCGSSSTAIAITVHALPLVTGAVSSPTVCSGSVVVFTGSGAANYIWDNGVVDGVNFIPTASGIFNVVGTNTNGCSASASVALTVVNSPTATPIASSTLICAGSQVTLSATGANSYQWLPSNLNSSVITVSPASTTTYTLSRANGICTNTQTLVIVVNQIPMVTASASPSSICSQNSALLIGQGALTYSWYAGTNLIATTPTLFVSPQSTTLYTVSVSNGLCANNTTVLLQVNALPTILINANKTTLCVGDTAILTASGATSYQWNSAVQGNTLLVTPTTNTLYSVTGTNNAGCFASNSISINVNSSPIVNITTPNAMICSGGSSTLFAVGANSYTWSNGTVSNSITLSSSQSTVVSVVGANLIGCKNTKTITISVFSPTVHVSATNSICVGMSATLNASGANSYTWVGLAPLPSTIVSPTVTTFYTVSVTSASNGVICGTSTTVAVFVHQNPLVTIKGPEKEVCRGEKITLFASGATSFTWHTNSSQNPLQIFAGNVFTYSVVGIDSNGCKSSSLINLKISNCTGISEVVNDYGIQIYPNPNTGRFFVENPYPIDLIIVNSLGQIISRLKTEFEGDRFLPAEELSEGVYFIIAESQNIKFRRKIVVMR